MTGTPSGTITSDSGNAADASYLGGAELYTTATTGSASWSCGSFTMPSNGLMVALFTGRDAANTTFTGATIGGSAATFCVLGENIAGADRFCLAYRQVSSGSNNVTWTANGNIGGNDTVFTCSVWYVSGHTLDIPRNLAYSKASATTSNSISFTAWPKCVTILNSWLYGASANFVWTGDSITTDNAFNQIGAGANRYWSAGHLQNATSSIVNNTVGSSWTTSGTCALLAVTFV